MIDCMHGGFFQNKMFANFARGKKYYTLQQRPPLTWKFFLKKINQLFMCYVKN
jgi:hypothetical protein